MTEDPTRAMPHQQDGAVPPYGRVGPADPTADPVTRPSMLPVQPADTPTVPTPSVPGGSPEAGAPAAVKRTRTGGLWVGLILSALVLVFLLVFILQNNVPVEINFLGASGTLPTGVALLFAAIAGLLLVAIPGGLRILQLRRAARAGARRTH
jgi:uncharacterized integral membrane protein